MKGNRWLTISGYLLSLYLITTPMVETVAAIYPISLGEPAWRFGAAGLLSQALMTPLLGLLIALGLVATSPMPAEPTCSCG